MHTNTINTLNLVKNNNALINTVLRWAFGESGSDYMLTLSSVAVASLNFGSRHEIATLVVERLEAQDASEGFMLPSRKVATVAVDDDGTATWSYKIGWGGTEIEINVTAGGEVEVLVRSFYYNEDARERIVKGTVVIYEDDRGVHAAWWATPNDHSFARLKWLLEHLEERFEVTHSGHVDRIRSFVPLAATHGW